MSFLNRIRSLFGGAPTAPVSPSQRGAHTPVTPAAVRALLGNHKRVAFVPVVGHRNPAVTQHACSQFCGLPMLLPNETHPTCGMCKKALHLFVQLNSADLPVAAARPFGNGLFQFFYCVECGGAYEPFNSGQLARVLRDDLSRLVPADQSGSHFPAKPIVGWTQTEDWPHPEDLSEQNIELTKEQRAALYESDDEGTPLQGEKLLGWPYWVQGAEYVSCPICKQRMKYLFQIDSEKNIPFMFGDCGVGHVSICERHPDVLTSTWACC